MPPQVDEPSWSGRRNPFPAAQLARVSGFGGPFPTIETAAVRAMREQVDTYLRATAQSRLSGTPDKPAPLEAGSGLVVVIVGEYGTGKTHLALDVLAHIENSTNLGGRDSRRIYLAAPGSSFLVIYRTLMENMLRRSDLIDQVREIYADVLVSSLRESSALPAALTERINSREIDPVLAVERLGLAENVLLDRLYERLCAITGDNPFGRALSLLVRPAHEDAAWQWLRGAIPDPTLVEYGIEHQIDSEERALQALSTVALLHGSRGQRFVLVLDEMEKLLLSGQWGTPENIQAFKQTLEDFRRAGALLACCGLPEMLSLFPVETGRAEPQITPSALTTEDVVWYVEQLQAGESGEPTLGPFDRESIEYLVRISGGVAREVIKMCYLAYDEVARLGNHITPYLLAYVARSRYSDLDIGAVRDEALRLLKDEGLEARADIYLDADEIMHVDVWAPFDDEGGGCAVIVLGTVLDQQEADKLVRLGTAIRSRDPRREALLVVTTFLSREFVKPLTGAFSARPVDYKWQTFQTEFLDAFHEATGGSALNRAVDDPLASAALGDLSSRIQRLSRQQSQSQRALRSMTDLLDSLGTATDGRLREIENQLRGASGRPGAGSRDAQNERRLPVALQTPFDDVGIRLSAFGDVGELCSDALGLGTQGAGPDHLPLVHGLRDESRYFSIGVAQLLKALVDAFHEAVFQWLETVRRKTQTPAPALSPDRERALRQVCQTFDYVYHSVPLFRLEDLSGLAGRADPPVSYRSNALRRADLETALDSLADDVLNGALRFVSG